MTARAFWIAIPTITTLTAAGMVAAQATTPSPSELLISEYIEASSTNKALELFNPTTETVALNQYTVQVYFNGKDTPGRELPLTGTIDAGGTFVVGSAPDDSALFALLNQRTAASLWNGDDAIVLRKGDQVIDSIGQVGTDPGSSWGTGELSTKDNTLVRKADVCAGDQNPTDAVDLSTEWTGVGKNVFTGLGTHAHNCGGTQPTPTPTTTPTATPNPTASPRPAECDQPEAVLGQIQGSGDVSPKVGQKVSVKATVTSTFTEAGFGGFYIQGAPDGDPATSDALFVTSTTAPAVQQGDVVAVTGTVTEDFTLTQIAASTISSCAATNPTLPEATTLSLPFADSVNLEAYEGMLVRFNQPLTINEYYNFDRFGEVVLGSKRHFQPTAVHKPGSDAAKALAAANARDRIILDDARTSQNPDPARHPAGGEFTMQNRFRGGDTLSGVTGVLDYRFNQWRIQPTSTATYTAKNQRPGVPNVGGNLTMASFNVLNYFTTLGERGANTPAELTRQSAKLVTALLDMDAAVVGLMEIENSPVALTTLVTELNQKAGTDRYAAINTGKIGTDAITQALIYQPAKVTPVGDWAILDSSVDPEFIDTKNRPTLAQTFKDKTSQKQVTVAVNHLKSKGSDCAAIGDPTDPNGQGNCNQTRTKAAGALNRWLATDPTKTGAQKILILGDLNAYDHEDPITTLTSAGWTDLVKKYGGEYAYSYVFNGQLGYLDHALANPALVPAVTGVAEWHTNADEPDLLNYRMGFKKPAQQALYAPDAFRASDHDAVLIGLDLTASGTEPTPATTVTAQARYGVMNIGSGSWLWTKASGTVTAAGVTSPAPVISVASSAPECHHVKILTDIYWLDNRPGCDYTFTFGDVADAPTVTKTVVVTAPGRPVNEQYVTAK